MAELETPVGRKPPGVRPAQERLSYRKGLLGDLLITLEDGDRRILVGNVPIWEDQDRVMNFIDGIGKRR